jgi:hypothetical protein
LIVAVHDEFADGFMALERAALSFTSALRFSSVRLFSDIAISRSAKSLGSAITAEAGSMRRARIGRASGISPEKT